MQTSHLSSSAARLMRGIAVAALLMAAGGAHAAIKSERLLAAILRHTPESTVVPAGEQMKRAEVVAEQIPGASVFWGVGRSMEPLFVNGTAVVVAPVNFKELQKGMTVLYVNRRGRMVAHPLIGDLPKGWIAQGVNNDEEDDDLVTKANLVGVIVHAFSEIQSETRVALTKQLVAKGRLAANRT